MNDLEKVIYTLGLSELHRSWTITDIINLILPPLKLKQYIFISNEQNLINLGPGEYSVEINDQNDCPFNIEGLSIIEPPAIAISEKDAEFPK